MQRVELKGRRYWRVLTGYSNSEDQRELGIHFGSLTEVAWHLADEARGFYMEHGYLEFHPVDPPPPVDQTLKPGKSRRVDISVYPTEKRQELTRKQLAEVIDPGSHLESSNHYGQVYLVKDAQ